MVEAQELKENVIRAFENMKIFLQLYERKFQIMTKIKMSN